MNWLLILVVLLVAGNIVWGFFRGFLRVVYSMAAWILILVFVTRCCSGCQPGRPLTLAIRRLIQKKKKKKNHCVIDFVLFYL